MKNIVDYAMEADHSLESSEFNAVDSLVLSKLAYLNFEGFISENSEGTSIPVREILDAPGADGLFRNVPDNKSNRKLLTAFANSTRFRDVKLAFYVNQIDAGSEKQFSAVTFLLPGDLTYVAFRGTDSSFVGWKEDFNMAFINPVPSQIEGVNYLNSISDRIPGALMTGGHSKGGNIAVYSAAQCKDSAQRRIQRIFSHDGPGFTDAFLQSSGYLAVRNRIHKTLPQSSIVGMLLQNQEDYHVVRSSQIWLLQHNPLTWGIEADDFQYVPSITRGATYRNRTLNQWMNSLDDQKREMFVSTLYQIIKATNAPTYFDLAGDWPRRAVSVLNAIKGVDDDTRKAMLQIISCLVTLAVKNIPEAKGFEDVPSQKHKSSLRREELKRSAPALGPSSLRSQGSHCLRGFLRSVSRLVWINDIVYQRKHRSRYSSPQKYDKLQNSQFRKES